MSVVRVKIQKDFTVLYNGVLENPRLSFKAKGLWAYCMSRPDNWQFHVNHLGTVSKEGVDAVYSALKELEAEGLVERTQKNEGGKFGAVDYIIYPYPEELKKCLPQTDFPLTEDPQTGNPPLTSTDPLPSTDSKISPIIPKGDHPKRKSIREEKMEVCPRVFISSSQEADILKRLKGDPIKLSACYSKLSSWKIGKEIEGGRNDYKAIIDWVIQAIEKEGSTKPQETAQSFYDKVKQYCESKNIKGVIFGHNYIEFEGMYDAHYKISDAGFWEKVQNAFRKMNINLKQVGLC